jgi:pyridoxine kinase
MKILSVQSWVASGHVGNAAAIFPLQRLGAEVMAIHTAQLSNHPGHGAFTGRLSTAEEVGALIDGLDAHGAFAGCDAVLSGYIGDASIGGAILDVAARIRAANAAALWCCDPVMGDDDKLYVRPGVAEFFAEKAVPAADILVPNQFELATLAGIACATRAEAKTASAALQARMRQGGPHIVLVSSLRCAETPDGALDMLLAAPAGCFLLRTELLQGKFNGAGDTLAALFLFHLLSTHDAVIAMTRAAESVATLLRRTRQESSAELLTITAQGAFVAPDVSLHAIPC